MNIVKNDLVKALAMVKPGLSSKEFIEQSTSFAFQNGRVITYNDEISISHPIVGMDIEGAIQAEALYSLLSKITQKKVKISLKEKELTLRAGKVKAGFALNTEVKLPLEEIAGKKKWKKLKEPKAFLKGVRFVAFSCSKDVTRPVLTSIHVQSNGELQATDNYRITTYKIDEMPVKSFLLPVNAANVLVNYPVKLIAQTTGWIHFKTEEGTELSARIYEGEFPEVSSLMKIKGSVLPLPASLDEMVGRSLVFTKKEVLINSIVEIMLTEGELTVKGKADTGWFEEVAKIEYSGTDIIFIINPLFLIDIAQESGWEVKLSKKADRMMFSGKKWNHLLMLQA